MRRDSLLPLIGGDEKLSQHRAAKTKSSSGRALRYLAAISVCTFLIYRLVAGGQDFVSTSLAEVLHVARPPDPCATFDPLLPPEQDPPGCWRAVKYRQLERIPAGFAASEFEIPQLQNEESIANLKRCLADTSGSCHPNTYTVVLGAWWYWTSAISDYGTSGEVIWMKSTIAALRELNYTLLTATRYQTMVQLHAIIPDVVSVVWAEDIFVLSCASDPRCLKGYRPTDEKDIESVRAIPFAERGTIPLWKLFSTTYWGARPGQYDNYWGHEAGQELFFNPLGNDWVISPYAYPGHSHIPFSIEKECTAVPFVPHNKRANELIVLAKYTYYFAEEHAPTSHTWALLHNVTGLDIVSTAVAEKEGDSPLDPNIRSVGELGRFEYEKQVGQAKVMLGVGRPVISPSVYTAMCQGVPVTMPYFGEPATPAGWDLYDPTLVQHGPAAAIGPPYVYSYNWQDEQALLQVVKEAVSKPVERFIPPEMKWDAVVARVDAFMHVDWRTKYNAIVSRNGGVEPKGMEAVVRHCMEWNRCLRMAGRS